MEKEYVSPAITQLGSFREETGFFLAVNTEILPPIGTWECCGG